MVFILKYIKNYMQNNLKNTSIISFNNLIDYISLTLDWSWASTQLQCVTCSIFHSSSFASFRLTIRLFSFIIFSVLFYFTQSILYIHISTFYFILFYFILFNLYFIFIFLLLILFYFILFYFILFYFILFNLYFIFSILLFILFYFILFYFILFYFILFYFIKSVLYI